jgi:hypothetical protein
VIAFLHVLKARLPGQRLRFEDRERRRLAELGHRLGRRLLAQVVTIVTPVPFCVGTASSWRANGLNGGVTVALACRHTFEGWSFEWLRKSDVGLHTDSGRIEEPRPLRRPLHDRTHSARRRHSPRPAASNDLADVCAGALARPPGGRTSSPLKSGLYEGS